ncbi:hypothetical protein EUZ85_02950 [Hahella sp. KA22]|uniref:hypothetical protein n=1 Tax=Hahella sp. KA22 TaxID=1628392 RepID=UPI000FDD9F29|nr:hypothetical protein [Hahella sp. KA22]AZZ89719.1 hypothetical protein ENC22_00405 [Hahella sp. KA22]QAY53089.1 hypothetical protein EUZ85_02950 [Hahella sp. KA22]
MAKTKQQRALTSTPELEKYFREVRRTKKLTGERSIDEWLECLRFIAARDKGGDKLRKRVAIAMALWIVGFILSLVVEFPPAAAGFAVIFIINLIIFFALQSKDVPNRLRDSVLPLLTILRQDTEANARLTLNVDLVGPELVSKRTDHRTLGGGPRIEQSIFRDPWFRGSLGLADNSILTWEVLDVVRRRKIRKRNRRGKTKTKTKYKIKTRMDISLSYKNDRYQAQVSSGATAPQVKKEGERRSVLRCRRQAPGGSSPGQKMALKELLIGVSMIYKSLRPVG